jgi:hypothetical protein
MQKLPFLALALVGCMNRGGLNLDTAEGAIESSDSTETEGTVMMAAVDGADASGLVAPTPDQVATRIAANVGLRWNPAGCATVASNGATVTITYNDCTGPRGLLHVSGELDLTVSVSGTGTISVHGASNGLKANDADLVIDLDATYAATATGHTLTVATMGSGTGPRGNTVDHEGNYTIAWDTASQCRSIMGHWQTDIGVRERSNDVNISRCVGGCPTGTLTHHFLGGASITVTFDGTAIAAWTASTGKSGTVNLTCGK